MYQNIRDLERDVRKLLKHGTEDELDDALAKLNEVEHVAARLARDRPFERFLQEYLRTQRDAFRDGERDEPLCRCSYPECDLKKGALPGRIRLAERTQAGIDEYQSRHPEAVILLEAREEWARLISEYRATLREVARIGNEDPITA